ncbi:MAG: PilW family protein [Woeseiaceae bacterium]|nr:PilW family protein [Woeseiaceae bacterium]
MTTPEKNIQRIHRQSGVTMVELMVSLAIGSFLIIGAVQIYNQSRQAFVINESIARVQETAQFAMDTIESDIRMASNWGRHSRGSAVEGRSLPTDANPAGLPAPATCGVTWAIDLGRPLEGANNNYGLPCAANGGAQANSDTVTVRRATMAPSEVPLQNDRLYLQTTRIQGELFADNTIPSGFDPLNSETHDLRVNTYYVAQTSALVPGVPTLRRKTLASAGGAPVVVDQEVAPGVENMQLQFGVDVDGDNAVDRYVNPGDDILVQGSGTFIPGARVITARIWLVVRSVDPEIGLNDQRDYEPGDVDLGVPNDNFRRLQVSKTILLRNARS